MVVPRILHDVAPLWLIFLINRQSIFKSKEFIHTTTYHTAYDTEEQNNLMVKAFGTQDISSQNC